MGTEQSSHVTKMRHKRKDTHNKIIKKANSDHQRKINYRISIRSDS